MQIMPIWTADAIGSYPLYNFPSSHFTLAQVNDTHTSSNFNTSIIATHKLLVLFYQLVIEHSHCPGTVIEKSSVLCMTKSLHVDEYLFSMALL